MGGDLLRRASPTMGVLHAQGRSRPDPYSHHDNNQSRGGGVARLPDIPLQPLVGRGKVSQSHRICLSTFLRMVRLHLLANMVSEGGVHLTAFRGCDMGGLEGVLSRPMFALPWAIVRSSNSLFDVREATYFIKKLLRRHAPFRAPAR